MKKGEEVAVEGSMEGRWRRLSTFHWALVCGVTKGSVKAQLVTYTFICFLFGDLSIGRFLVAFLEGEWWVVMLQRGMNA